MPFPYVIFVFLSISSLSIIDNVPLTICDDSEMDIRCKEEVCGLLTNCWETARDDWENFQDTPKRNCCSHWDFLDCALEVLRSHCHPDDLERYEKYSEAKVKGSCEEFPRNSLGKCRFPWWGILICSVGGVLLIVTVAYCYFKIKRRRGRRVTV